MCFPQPQGFLAYLPFNHEPVLQFPGQLCIGQPSSYHMPHAPHEPLNVAHGAVIVAPRLLVNVTEKVKRFNRNVGAMPVRFRRLQKFSIQFVWTFPSA